MALADDHDPGGLGAAQLAERLGLAEDLANDGSARLVLRSRLRGEPEAIGSLRRFIDRRSAVGVELLWLRVAVPMLGLDVERVFAWSPATSTIPHLVLGRATTGALGMPGLSTFTADLLPRVDLAVNAAYAKALYGPLEGEIAAYEHVLENPVTAVEVAPRLRRIASPWALRSTSAGDGTGGAGGLIEVYVRRFVELCAVGRAALEVAGLHAPAPQVRDRRLRAGLSDPQSEPLWSEIDRLCGGPTASALAAWVRGDAG